MSWHKNATDAARLFGMGRENIAKRAKEREHEGDNEWPERVERENCRR